MANKFPKNPTPEQTAKYADFKSSLRGLGIVDKVAESAAQKFIIQNDTSVPLADYIKSQLPATWEDLKDKVQGFQNTYFGTPASAPSPDQQPLTQPPQQPIGGQPPPSSFPQTQQPPPDQQPVQFESILKEIADLRSREATLDSSQLGRYVSLLNTLNQGDPKAWESFKVQKKSEFKNELLALGVNESAAESTAQRFIIDRKTGEISVRDWLREKIGESKYKPIETGIINLERRLGEFINTPSEPGQQATELARVNKILSERRSTEQAALKETALQDLATQQRQQAQTLFGQATEAFGRPVPQFTPEFTQAMLADIQRRVLEQGERAISETEAKAFQRGLTGSSIEQFGLSETGNNIANALANQTFQFLLQSGTAGQRNREFLANTLFQQAQTLLGAGQQTQALGTQTGLTAQELGLRRDILAQQIAQFNQQFAESRRQFESQMEFQRSKAAEDLSLLMQQLSQGGRKRGIGALAGGFGGAGLGALIGGLLAIPTGGLSVAAGAGLGGFTGLGVGSSLGTALES